MKRNTIDLVHPNEALLELIKDFSQILPLHFSHTDCLRFIEDSTGTYGGSYFNQTMTGSDGAFDIHGLPNGTYTLLIGVDMSKPISSPDNQALASKTITIQDGRLTDVKVGN